MNYIEDVPEDKVFLLGEKRIKNLYGLLFEFREMNDDTYGHYASADHNYFADWVLHVIGNSELAERLKSTKSRKEAIETLESVVESIRKSSEKVDPAPDTPKYLPTFDEKKAEKAEAEVKTEKPEKIAAEKRVEKNIRELPKEDNEEKIYLWKHFGWEMAKEFMYGLAFGILIGLILAKMFFR